MPAIEVGRKAPAFSLKDQAGKTHTLAQYAGKPVVLYFYPKDDTPGCTREACDFRDSAAALKKRKAVVLGVSILDVASKKKFADKHGLDFPLLADPDHAVAEKYGAWVQKTLYGRTSMGVARTTYLIDPAGKVARRWDKVKVDGHAEEVLGALDQL
jgi:peroxiredoxin Q/BCP